MFNDLKLDLLYILIYNAQTETYSHYITVRAYVE